MNILTMRAVAPLVVSAIVGGMPARTTRESTPDLFAPTEEMASPAALPRSPNVDPTVGAVPSLPQLLPEDLSGALKYLDDQGIDRLLSAVIDEARRRDRLPPRLSAETREDKQRSGPRRRAPTTNRSKLTTDKDALALTQGRINAVRAAFKAGVKPSAIARQFGLSLSAVRQALDPAAGGAKS